MKRTKYQNDEERSVLTSLITNHRVLARVVSKTDKEPFRSKWSNLVFKWCKQYFDQYQKAPGKHIQKSFVHFAEKSQDEATVGIVEKFLECLSDEYQKLKEPGSEDFLVDNACRHFNRVKLEKQAARIEECLNRGDLGEAQQIASSFQPVNLAAQGLIQANTDKEFWRTCLSNEEEEVLIRYPAGLGEFFDTHLQRDAFIAFLAPEKRGKTGFLLDLAWRAANVEKRRTLFFSVGDMSMRQLGRRYLIRTTGHPLRPQEVRRPTKIRLVPGGSPKIKYQTRTFEDPLSQKRVNQVMAELVMKSGHSKSLLQIECTPNSTTRVADIENKIEDLIREEWIPDVIVIDYADILAPERVLGDGDYRHQTDETWKALRRLSQKYHLLVVTATQSNAASYESTTLRRTHFSEDKRKLAHVTGMVGINQTDEEKQRGVYRLNWILLREGYYTESRCVTTAGCLAIGNPAIVSAW